ncbi:MAG: hypothetical protein AAFX81_16185 [Pseudomonadota bacterium]
MTARSPRRPRTFRGWRDARQWPRVDAQLATTYACAFGAIIVAWVWLTVPWWYQGLSVPFDSQNHFYAMLRGLARHLAAGDWPAWMGEIHGGGPTLADPQSMVTAPSFLLLAWLDPEPSLLAMDLLVLLHLLLGALALAVWGLRRGAHPLAVVLAALVFAFGGAAMARLQHTLLVLSYAWLPVAIVAVEVLLDRPSWRRGVATGLVLAVLTLNRDHVAFLGHFVLIAVALAKLGGCDSPWNRFRQALPAIALAVAVWAAAVALPLAATVAYVVDSSRPGFDADTAARLALQWGSLLTLPFPNLFSSFSSFGHEAAFWGPSSPSWPGPWIDRTVIHLALGVPAVVMLLWLGVLRGGLLAPGARLGAGIAVTAMAFAVGDRAPLFRPLFEVVPGFDLFRRPADATYIFNLGLALAVLGITDRYLQAGLPSASRVRAGLEAGAGVALVGLALAVAIALGRFASAWPAVLIPSLFGIVTIALIVAGARGDPRHRAWAVAVVWLLTVADLTIHNTGTELNARSPADADPLAHPEDDPLARWLRSRMAEVVENEGPMRVEIRGLGGAWQNVALPLGIITTQGYNPLRSGAYDQATGKQDYSHEIMPRPFGTLMTSYASPFADLLGIRYIVLGAPMAEFDPTSEAAFSPPLRIGGAWIYDNADALPLVRLIGAEAAHPHDPEALLASGDLPGLDWSREALIEGVPAPAGDVVPTESAGSVEVVGWGADRVQLRVEAKRDAFVIWAELADPGWTARVGGLATPIHRANVLFQAVPVRPGTHDVVLDYASWRAVLRTIADSDWRPATVSRSER